MPTPALRTDAAVEAVLAGERPRGDLADITGLVHAALRPLPPGVEFEARLRRRLAGGTRFAWPQLTPSRLLAAGAVSSAALGVTAVAVYVSRRQPAHRPAHR